MSAETTHDPHWAHRVYDKEQGVEALCLRVCRGIWKPAQPQEISVSAQSSMCSRNSSSRHTLSFLIAVNTQLIVSTETSV